MFGPPSPLSKSRLRGTLQSRRLSPRGSPRSPGSGSPSGEGKVSFGLPNEVKSPRFRSGNKSVPAPLKLEELPDDAPSGPSSSPKRATSQTPPAPTKEWGAERVQVLCAPTSGAVTPSFAVVPPHLSDNVFRSISVASTAHTNYTNYSAAHSDDSSIVSTAQAALAAASEAMRQEAVKAATARQQLEDQSRRLEAQLAATNQILQPLMSPRVQHLLHQIQSPKHFAAPQSQTTQAQFLTHGYVGGYGHSSGSCSAAPVTVRRTVRVAPPRVVSQVPVHTSTVAAAAAPKQVIPGLDATQKEDNTGSDQQQVSTSSSVGVQTSCELPSEVPAQDLALKEIAEALAFASRDLGTEGPSLEQVKQDRDCIRQAIAKGRAAGLSEEELATAEQQRRRLHNLYQDLKGQLRVYCRVRPLNSRERRIGDKEAMQVVDKSTLEVRSTGDVFEFDGIFGSSDSQADVFEDCCDLAQSAVDGQNVTVFCYGITGAGKTYTMYGTPEEDGLAQRMFGEVFAQVDVRPQANVTVMGSMMELYNNYLVDLLRPIDWQGRQSPALSLKLDRLGTVQEHREPHEHALFPKTFLAREWRGGSCANLRGVSCRTGCPESMRTDTTELLKLGAALAITVAICRLLWVKGTGSSKRKVAEPGSPKSPGNRWATPKASNGTADALWIYYGSQTGTAEGFAQELEQDAANHEIGATVVDLEDFDPDTFKTHKAVVMVLATYGEGDPTDNATEFFKWLADDSVDSDYLKGVKFTVMGCGNRQYVHFNQSAKIADQRLECLGAERVYERGEGDDDQNIEEDFEQWRENGLWPALRKALGLAGSENVKDEHAVETAESVVKRLPLKLELAQNIRNLPVDPLVQVGGADVLGKWYFQASQASVAVCDELRQKPNADAGKTTKHIEFNVQQLPAVDWRTADNLEGNPHGRSECRGVGASGQTAMGCGASQAKSHLQEAPAPSEATTGTTKTSESVARKVEKLEIETSAAVAESYTESPVASPVASPLASAPTPASPSKSRPRAPKAPQATWIENGRSYRKTPGRATAMRRNSAPENRDAPPSEQARLSVCASLSATSTSAALSPQTGEVLLPGAVRGTTGTHGTHGTGTTSASNEAPIIANTLSSSTTLASVDTEEAQGQPASPLNVGSLRSVKSVEQCLTTGGERGPGPGYLTDLQVAQLGQIFSFVDKNGDGKLTRKELLIGLKKSPAVRTLFEISGSDLEQIQADFEGQGRLGSAEGRWCLLTSADEVLNKAEFIRHFVGNPEQALKGIRLHCGDPDRPKFTATQDWQPVPKGAACPPGLEYKMDLATGETLGRLCKSKA
ncbi:redB [Symbiodinium necroappetens]|uniref:RedB protein n=1 Tax=Symbiodinium necroappetens TaxID=1628268 RepID=A0A812VLM4_9DINO|nr:redB [Symbiodinium necroappetens]